MTTALPDAHSNQSPDEHMQISRRFVQHAREELDQGERLQASEKIWGAAQHALAAVGKERGWNTDKYDQKVAIANHLSQEFANPQIRVQNRSYESYHVNFYQNSIDRMELAEAIADVEQFVNEMERIRKRGPQPFTITDQEQITRLRQLAGSDVASTLRMNQTYKDGFVNQPRLARYRPQWRENRYSGSPDDHDIGNANDDAGNGVGRVGDGSDSLPRRGGPSEA